MNISVHLMVSLAISLILFPIFYWYSFLILVGGFLIDFDHYIDYVISKKDWNLKRAYFFFKKGRDIIHIRLHIFHTMEFWILLLIASFYSEIIFIIFIGAFIHMIMDLSNLYIHNSMPRANSLIFWMISRKKKER